MESRDSKNTHMHISAYSAYSGTFDPGLLPQPRDQFLSGRRGSRLYVSMHVQYDRSLYAYANANAHTYT